MRVAAVISQMRHPDAPVFVLEAYPFLVVLARGAAIDGFLDTGNVSKNMLGTARSTC